MTELTITKRYREAITIAGDFADYAEPTVDSAQFTFDGWLYKDGVNETILTAADVFKLWLAIPAVPTNLPTIIISIVL